MINVLLATITEVIHAQQDHATGNVEKKDVVEAKKRFARALNEVIDYRIDLAMEDRRRKMSHDRIATADSINAGVKSMATNIKSLSALNSAPPPPENITDPDALQKWRDNYAEWYNNKRKSGITIE